MMHEPASLDVFGLKVTPMTADELIALLAERVGSTARFIVANQNLHGAYLFFSDGGFRALHQRALVHIDGMPIVWLARLAGARVDRAHRLTYIDLMPPVLRTAAARGWRVFYLGSEPDVLTAGLERLRTLYPGLVVAGAHGYFDQRPTSADNRRIVAEINAARPNLLVIGMGMPRQEHWLGDNIDGLAVDSVLLAGAYLDYVAGRQATPPRWLGPLGLEWLHRLASDPRRLWARYLVEPWFVLFHIACHRWRRGGRT
ncbi:MAG: WecB/TagA/CpsF family glycosyltransferase [Dongiaceae bacterium]